MKPIHRTSHIAARREDSNGKARFYIRLFLNNETLADVRLNDRLEAEVSENADEYLINRCNLGVTKKGTRLSTGVAWYVTRVYDKVPECWQSVGKDWTYFQVKKEAFRNSETCKRFYKGEEMK